MIYICICIYICMCVCVVHVDRYNTYIYMYMCICIYICTYLDGFGLPKLLPAVQERDLKDEPQSFQRSFCPQGRSLEAFNYWPPSDELKQGHPET